MYLPLFGGGGGHCILGLTERGVQGLLKSSSEFNYLFCYTTKQNNR